MTLVSWTDPARQNHFEQWLGALAARHGLDPCSVCSASADASFRRYLRVRGLPGQGIASRIIMDAPPELENSAPFVQVARVLAEAGLHVPEVLEWEQTHGFLLLSDLGAHTLMDSLDVARPRAAHADFVRAIDALVQMQLASRPGVLPVFDTAYLHRELDLFPQWYLGQYRGHELSAAQQQTLDTCFAAIAQTCLAAPPVFVHSDFMPRNLMRSSEHGPLGVLDFQDAVYGPITYDIASLMRDAFLSWEEDFVLDITIRYWEKARRAGLPVDADFGDFYRGVEWMGLQRHLRIAGVFARLTLRDGKPRYLADAPRFIGYIRATAARYRELGPLLRLIDQVEGTTPATGFAYGRM